MRFETLLSIVGDQPLFESGVLLAGDVDAADVHRQLVRWVGAGRILQVRRGLYTLAPPYARVRPHPFLVANRLVRGSYVSLQSALAWAGLILESVPVVTSISTSRPSDHETPVGSYRYHHIHRSRLFGFQEVEVAPGQHALVATPAKALLDLVHLQPGGENEPFLDGLRLQNLEDPFVTEVRALAVRLGQPRMLRAAAAIRRLAEFEKKEFESL